MSHDLTSYLIQSSAVCPHQESCLRDLRRTTLLVPSVPQSSPPPPPPTPPHRLPLQKMLPACWPWPWPNLPSRSQVILGPKPVRPPRHRLLWTPLTSTTPFTHWSRLPLQIEVAEELLRRLPSSPPNPTSHLPALRPTSGQWI